MKLVGLMFTSLPAIYIILYHGDDLGFMIDLTTKLTKHI